MIFRFFYGLFSLLGFFTFWSWQAWTKYFDISFLSTFPVNDGTFYMQISQIYAAQSETIMKTKNLNTWHWWFRNTTAPERNQICRSCSSTLVLLRSCNRRKLSIRYISLYARSKWSALTVCTFRLFYTATTKWRTLVKTLKPIRIIRHVEQKCNRPNIREKRRSLLHIFDLLHLTIQKQVSQRKYRNINLVQCINSTPASSTTRFSTCI